MKVEFHLTKASAALWLKEINDMIETRYIGSTGDLILMKLGQEIAAASAREEQEEIDRPTVKELMACETFDSERPAESPYFNQHGKMEVW
jgi:hypothetical protein